MTAELRDLRAKITVESDAALDVVSRVTGKDRSEIVRDIIHRWALEQVSISTLLGQRLKAEGVQAAGEGASGSASR
jgi:hypothetical protein